MNAVLNRQPTQYSQYRIALIGDFPSRDDEQFQRPFTGTGGRFLGALLSRAGVQLDACFQGNICQHRPIDNDISRLNWSGPEIQDGLENLKNDLALFKPNIIVLFGNLPFKAAKDPVTIHPLKPKGFRFKTSQWRGSLFLGVADSPFEGVKCLTTYHPTYSLRDYDTTPLLQFDLRKAVREGTSPLLNLPQRQLDVNLPEHIILDKLNEIRRNKTTCAIDIEGGIDTMSCISFATSPSYAFIVPINKNTSPAIWQTLAATLEDSSVGKVLQNSLYDRFVLHYSYGIRVGGVVDDTMLKHWELYSELEKSLGIQTSIYTDEPYYKFERKADDDDTFYKYCCKDSAVTLEISDKLNNYLGGCSLQHYRMNMGMLNPLLYMELRGIRYDTAGAEARRENLRNQLHALQAKLNGLTGHGFSWQKGIDEVKQKAREVMWRKDGKAPLKPYVETVERLEELLRNNKPDLAVIGEIEDLCEVSLNVGSGKQFMAYLYETIKLPTQMSNVRGEEPHPTADYEALLNLSRWCTQHKHEHGFKVCQMAIELRSLQTRQQMLSINADKDGRIRCGYNLVGSNTGRITCYESPTGSGYNLQTIPNYTDVKDAPGGVLGDRDLFISDEEHHFFQCDLAGADGWTVAAYSAMLGDSTMLEDLRAGIKVAKVLALAMRGLAIPQDRAELLEACKVVKKEDWDYFAGKRVQHGGAYLEGGLTISRNCLKDSEGKLYIPPVECDRIKNKVYFSRYHGILKWHDWTARRLKETGKLTAASGQVRQFFGRTDEVLTKAVAFEPQANTTYATNLATWRLWNDPENRVITRQPTNRTSLRIEPLHTVHDALCGQFPKVDTSWAAPSIKSYFDNPLLIAGQHITIPYEGGYGRSWGELPNKL